MSQKLFGNLFISAGAMKAGTTWLFSILSRHPELHFTPEKEIHYFHHRYVDPNFLSDPRRLERIKTRHLDTIDPKHPNIDRIRLNLHWAANYLSRPVDDFWYRNLFTYPRKETYGCDFSNLYALMPETVWPRIADDCDRLRVLYTLRHPVKRLWSHVKFHLQVINKVDALDTWEPQDFETFARQPFIWKNAEYGEAVRRLKAGLSDDMLKLIFFEDMHADQRGALAGIEDFLGIAHFNYPENLLSQKVNTSVERKMPDFFPRLFEKDFERIGKELRAEGLTLPAAWQ